MAGWIKTPLGTEVGLGQGDFVLNGDRAPPPKGSTAPNFRPVYSGQTARWIKIPLGREVGLGPGDIALDGDPAPPTKKGHSPNFLAHVYCDQTAGCIGIPLGTEVGLGPGYIAIDGAQLPFPGKKGYAPSFRPTSIVAKRSPISATAELLY